MLKTDQELVKLSKKANKLYTECLKDNSGYNQLIMLDMIVTTALAHRRGIEGVDATYEYIMAHAAMESVPITLTNKDGWD